MNKQYTQTVNQTDRKWTVFVIQHSHVDIGYTHRPEQVAEYHRQFIGQAVDFALSSRQAERDAASTFKFTCEAFWAVEQFLSRADAAERTRFQAALKSGYLELTVLYANFAGLLDEGHLHDTILPAIRYAEEAGIPLTAAMSSDVNGLPQALVDPLNEHGIKYLYVSINPEFGGSPLGGPLKPFYWETPSGSRILVWSGPTYNNANIAGLVPGLTPGYGFSIPGVTVPGVKGLTDVHDLALAEQKLIPLLQGLESAGYPYDFIALMASGCCYDNSPVSDSLCELIATWNDTHGDSIYIRTACISEFFQHVEQAIEEIPVYRGDWIDWWADGVNSTPAELMIFRNAQRTKRLVEMLDPDHKTVSERERDEIYRYLKLFAEHTWGDSRSVNNPWHFEVQQQLQRKCSCAAQADRLAMAALDRVKQACGEGEFTWNRPLEYTVINPLDRKKSDIARLELTITERHQLKNGTRVFDTAGIEYPCQEWDKESVAVPVTLGPGERKSLRMEFNTENAGSGEPLPMAEEFEGRYYRAAWCEKKGLSSLVLLPEELETLDWSLPALGTPVYQRFDDSVRKTMNAGEMFIDDPSPNAEQACGYLRDVTQSAAGPVYTAWEFAYEIAGAAEFTVCAIFYRDAPVIDIILHVTKETVSAPESMYAVFPFRLPGNTWYIDRPGYPVRPGIDQLPGSCCDYYDVQYGAVLAADNAGIAVTMLDTVMTMIGDIRLMTYTTDIKPEGPLFSWLCSNKWGTNFKSDCGGMYGFRYRVEISRLFSCAENGIQACRDNAYPFVTVRK